MAEPNMKSQDLGLCGSILLGINAGIFAVDRVSLGLTIRTVDLQDLMLC